MSTRKMPLLHKWALLKWSSFLYFNPLPTIVRLTRRYGDILHLRVSENKGLILVNHPDFVQHILKTREENYSRKRVLSGLNAILGDGLFASEGKLWEQQQELLKPAFHHQQVTAYYNVVFGETSVLLEQWKTKTLNKTLTDIELDMGLLTLKILLKTQFSSSLNPDCKEIIRCLHLILKSSSYKDQNIKLAKGKLRKLFFLGAITDAKAIDALKILEKIIRDIRKDASENTATMGFALKTLEQAKAKGLISDKQVLDEMMNFIFAGFDTTASALTWTLYCFAKHKQQGAQLLNEINIVLRDKAPEMEALLKMPFTKMFIQESLRLYPPVWSLLRLSNEEDHIKGYTFPKDSLIMICIYALHRHPAFWENPESFEPQRFTTENFKGKAYVYIPFGQGKRVCIGKPLAMMEIQLILPMLLQRFIPELVSNKEPKINPGVIIKAKKTLMMKIISRN